MTVRHGTYGGGRMDIRQDGDLREVKPDPKPASTKKRRADMDAAGVFKATVCAEPCIGENLDGHRCDGDLQAMHVVPKQTLRRRGLAHLIYDPINAVSACYRHHRRRDNGTEKLPRTLLPARCSQWAVEHNLSDSLERHWPAPDPTCPACGERYINRGAHLEACTGRRA